MAHYKCRICKSESRQEIDKSLLTKEPYRNIAKKFIDGFDCDLHLLEQSISNHSKHLSRASLHELTDGELSFLNRLKNGDATTSEINRMVAVKVFEKILRYPDDLRFVDFFRSELLALKKQELESKNSWAEELVGRTFAGMLPPPNCPSCGERAFDVNFCKSL